MRVRDWQDLVEDVVESDVEPTEWRAVAGDRNGGLGEDLYLGHPAMGVYQLKTFAKNPFDVQGVGARIDRTVDDDLAALLPGEDAPARFAVNDAPEDADEAEEVGRRVEEVVRTHADAPTTGEALFDDVMEAMDAPAFGPMEYDQFDRPDALDDLSTTFADAEAALEAEFEEVVADAGVERGFE